MITEEKCADILLRNVEMHVKEPINLFKEQFVGAIRTYPILYAGTRCENTRALSVCEPEALS